MLLERKEMNSSLGSISQLVTPVHINAGHKARPWFIADIILGVSYVVINVLNY